jgi:ABC-type transport system involved in cytochrome c biogenesis permease subunit
MIALLAATLPLQQLIVGFLVIIVVLAIIYGVIWAIESWIHPIPPPVKLILAIVLVCLVVIWAMRIMGGM